METIRGDSQYSKKSRLVALLLCFFFGYFGFHRFYVGKIGTGIIMLLLPICIIWLFLNSLWVFGIIGLLIIPLWVFIDLILILTGSFRDKDGKKLFYWFEPGSVR